MEQNKQKFYTFGDEDLEMTFREWRRFMAEHSNPTDDSDNSNIERIANKMEELLILLNTETNKIKAEQSKQLTALSNNLKKLIADRGDGAIVISGEKPSDTYIFNDNYGTQISEGVFDIDNINLEDELRFKHYMVEEIDVNGIPHLRFSYVKGGVR